MSASSASSPSEKFQSWIGLGSNLGDSRATLSAARTALRNIGTIRATSSLWQSEPVGPITGQPVFLNAVILVTTALPPEKLLESLLAIERTHGRDRSAQTPQGPRTLDLDLLLVEINGDPVLLDLPGLTLPHPQLARRRFVLAPLAEISPATIHPTLRKTSAELLAALPAEGPNAPAAVIRIGPLN
jgi:2-amino-4-hydroxy-6-hydroxymethyldihydropteridine diphosphokinase